MGRELEFRNGLPVGARRDRGDEEDEVPDDD